MSEKSHQGNIIVYLLSRRGMKPGTLLVVLMMVCVPATGCIHTNDGGGSSLIEEESDTRIFVTGPDGMSLDIPPIPVEFFLVMLGRMEPSLVLGSLRVVAFSS